MAESVASSDERPHQVGDSPQAEADGARPQIQFRQEWYQTDSQVVVSLLTKNLLDTDIVDTLINDNTVDFKAKSREGDNEFRLHLDLAHSVLPAASSSRRFPSKVEIKLVKAMAHTWSQLEKPTPEVAISSSSPAQDNNPDSKYPSSSVQRRDWDKIAADIARLEAEEKVEGEAGVNKLFQDLYEGGSDEVRRAMNKSYMESGGTVLSTNWKDVGSKKVTINPPDGVEFKKWDS